MLALKSIRRLLEANTGKLAAVALLAVLTPGACNHAQDGSGVDVTNGLDINEGTYPAVVQILMGNASCTGTFVSETTMITAAHCVLEGDEIRSVRVAQTGAQSTKILVHPNATGNVGGEDLTVVIFPRQPGQKVMPLSKRKPQAGDAITIVGYGLSDVSQNNSAGTKRLGKNKLLDASGNELVFGGELRNVGAAGNGENSASASGDSGGPMFISDELVGVTSGGTTQDDTKYSFYVNLLSASNQAFLKSTLARGAEIPALQDADPIAAAGRDLFVAIGEPDNGAADSFTLFAGVGEGVASVVFCRAEKVSLCPETADGFTRAVKDRALAGRQFFKGVSPTALKSGEIMSFVAFDAAGKIVSAKAVTFQAAE